MFRFVPWIVGAASLPVPAAHSAGAQTAQQVPKFKAVEQTQPLELQCREGILAAGDRLLEAVSFKGRGRLLSFLDDARRAASAIVDERDLKFFRLPR